MLCNIFIVLYIVQCSHGVLYCVILTVCSIFPFFNVFYSVLCFIVFYISLRFHCVLGGVVAQSVACRLSCRQPVFGRKVLFVHTVDILGNQRRVQFISCLCGAGCKRTVVILFKNSCP